VTDFVQPDTGDDTVSVHTLALEMDTSASNVLAHARELKIRARDSSHRLTPEQADMVRTYYWLTEGTLPQDKPAEVLPGFTPGTTRPDYDPEMAALEQRFRVPRHRRHDHQPGRPPPSTPRPTPPHTPLQRIAPPEPELTGLAAEISRVLPKLSRLTAIAVGKVWAQHGLTDEQTVAWLENGLEPGEARVAIELAGYGVQPHHLQIVIRREPVVARLRDGRLSPRWIADLLKREGFLAAA
jgi:hypothetical protein